MDAIVSNSTSLLIASLPPFPPLTTTHLTTLPATATVQNRRRRRLQLSRKSVSSFPPPPPPLLTVRKTAIICGAIPEINQSQFSDTVLKSDRPVLVEFVATWCGPCRLISPVMESVAQEYSDRLVVVKIDCDANPELIEEYKVYGLPALILFKNGQEVSGSRREGAITKAKLKEYLDSLLEAISVT